jgi:hypothetical protein
LKTLGIDLSTKNPETGAVVVEWTTSTSGSVVYSERGVGRTRDEGPDRWLIELAESDQVEAVAIDVPFGWPRPWRDAIGRHAPGVGLRTEAAPRDLTWRTTDAWVAEYAGITPLRVGASLLGATAIRGARLVAELADAGRHVDVGKGDPQPGCVMEAYPAAARKLGSDERLVVDTNRFSIPEKGHLRDALTCAIVARLALDGGTPDVDEAVRWVDDIADPSEALEIDPAIVVEEGWIRLPRRHASDTHL